MNVLENIELKGFEPKCSQKVKSRSHSKQVNRVTHNKLTKKRGNSAGYLGAGDSNQGEQSL